MTDSAVQDGCSVLALRSLNVLFSIAVLATVLHILELTQPKMESRTRCALVRTRRSRPCTALLQVSALRCFCVPGATEGWHMHALRVRRVTMTDVLPPQQVGLAMCMRVTCGIGQCFLYTPVWTGRAEPNLGSW